jgi:predicted ferric reductase
MNRRLLLLAAAAAYIALLITPLILGLVLPSSDVMPARPFIDNLGSGLAMVAFAAILVEFFLLGRFRPLSTSLGSDFLMQAHQLFARTAGVFILLHPFLYTLWGEVHRAGDTTYERALRISGDSLLTGLIAWSLLLAVIVSALRRNRPGANYDRWRFWHGMMALMVIIFGMHHTLSAGRYAMLTEMQIFWWVLFSLALLSIFTVYVIRPWLQKRHAFVVTSVQARAAKTWELIIRPLQQKKFSYRAGQFAWLKLGSTNVTEDHPFSIASAPGTSQDVQFLIKEVGDFTGRLPELERELASKTTLAFLDGPHGHFQIPAGATAVVMIAGGIGIAPFVSLLRDCANQRDSRPIRLIYGNRFEQQAVDLKTLVDLEQMPDFQQISAGQLDHPALTELLSRPELHSIKNSAVFMVCGPAIMIEVVEAGLVQCGIPLKRIISEKFQYDFSGQSPRSKRTLLTWLLISVGLAVAIVIAA